jgi:hypothetical protein
MGLLVTLPQTSQRNSRIAVMSFLLYSFSAASLLRRQMRFPELPLPTLRGIVRSIRRDNTRVTIQRRLTSQSSTPNPRRLGCRAPASTTLRESERNLILRALRTTGWVVGGSYAAAARLGIKRTALLSRMKKHGSFGRQIRELRIKPSTMILERPSRLNSANRSCFRQPFVPTVPGHAIDDGRRQ